MTDIFETSSLLKLLLQTKLIKEFSAIVGEYDNNHFTKLFKPEVNCAPREYRNSNIEVNVDN